MGKLLFIEFDSHSLYDWFFTAFGAQTVMLLK